MCCLVAREDVHRLVGTGEQYSSMKVLYCHVAREDNYSLEGKLSSTK
jgi:hypothetical protein